MFKVDTLQVLTKPAPIGLAVASVSILLIALIGSAAGGSSEPEAVPVTPQVQQAQARSDIRRILCAIDSYATDHGGKLPTSLFPLLQRGENGQLYIGSQRQLTDPWHREYVYVREPVNVMSYGRDGAPGGIGEDSDIDSAEVLAQR